MSDPAALTKSYRYAHFVTHTYTRTHAPTHAQTHIHIHARTHARTHAHTCTHAHTQMRRVHACIDVNCHLHFLKNGIFYVLQR